MTQKDDCRVRLKGGLEHTVSWVYLRDDGSLIVEYYDHSERAHEYVGEDVAWLLTVEAVDKPRLLDSLLGADANRGEPDIDRILLQAMADQVDSYFEAQTWFDEHGIPYRKERDPFA